MKLNQVCCKLRDFIEIREKTQKFKFFPNFYQEFSVYRFCSFSLMSFRFIFYGFFFFFFLGFLFGLLEKKGYQIRKERQWSKHKPRSEKVFQIHNDYKVAHNSFPNRFLAPPKKIVGYFSHFAMRNACFYDYLWMTLHNDFSLSIVLNTLIYT